MNIDSILAVTDFTAQSEHATDRAAHLAQRLQTTLRLIHFAEKPHPYITEPLARLSQRARQLARRHGIRVRALDIDPATVDDILKEARGSVLLVVGPRRRGRWTSLLRGSTLDRLMHASPCPLLVVRLAASQPYAHVLVAVDMNPRSKKLVACARWLADASALKLFHAIDTIEDSRQRLADVSFEALHASRMGSRQRALEWLQELTRVFGPGAAPVALDVDHGDPAYQTALQQRTTRAELVVVGKRRASVWARLFAGSTAQRLAQWVDSDVLVVPFDGATRAVGTQAVAQG